MKRKVKRTIGELKEGQEFWSVLPYNEGVGQKAILCKNSGNLFSHRSVKIKYIAYYPETHIASWYDNDDDTEVFVEEEYTVISELKAGQQFKLSGSTTIFTRLEQDMGDERKVYYRDNLSKLYWTTNGTLEVFPL